MSEDYGQGDLAKAVKSDDPRTALEAIRDYLVHELEVNRCKTCLASKLRTGDTASLVLRLESTLDRLEALPKHNGEVTQLDRIRARTAGNTNAKTEPPSPQAVQRRPSGRRSGGLGGGGV